MTESQSNPNTASAVHGYGDALRFLAGRQGDAAQPGDLFLVEATADAPLEWLVLEKAGPGTWRVVAADLNPSSGSRDVAIDPEGWAGPITLRCAISAVVPQAWLRPELRTGVVPAEVLELAQKKCQEIQSRTLVGTALEQEVDRETEYQDWNSEVLLPALEAVKASWPPRLSEAVLEAPLESPTVVAPGGFQGWQMAAAILATVGVTLLFSQAWSGREPSMPSHGGSPAPLVNTQLEWFQPETDATRGVGREILLSPHGQWLTFVLETWNPMLFPSYGVELERSPGAELVWTHGQLQRQGASEVILTLPSSMLPPGNYIFRLSGQQDGDSLPLEEFSFSVRRSE